MRLAFARARTGSTDKLARLAEGQDADAPHVRLAVVKALGRGELVEKLHPKGVGMILHTRHLCMEMRGVQIAGTVTTTSALRGVFLDDARCRREFLEFDAKPDRSRSRMDGHRIRELPERVRNQVVAGQRSVVFISRRTNGRLSRRLHRAAKVDRQASREEKQDGRRSRMKVSALFRRLCVAHDLHFRVHTLSGF